jgi:steroid 5-alpha reductase family enzyme
MVVGSATTYAISAYHHSNYKFDSCSWWGVIDTTLHDKVCKWIAAGQVLWCPSPMKMTAKI